VADARQGPRHLAVLADVQAEGRFVAGHRLQVVDHVVMRAARRRYQLAVLQLAHDGARAHPLQLGFERGALAIRDRAVEVEGLDVGIAQQQRGGEIVELRARDRLHRGEQLVGDVQDFDGVVHALAQGRHPHRGALFEGQRLVVDLEPVDRQRQHGGRHQAAP
jgi:hypothetical protein